MGAGGVAGHGIAAGESPGIVLRDLAARLRVWVSAGGARLLDRVSLFRLARPFHRGGAAGVAGHLHPGAGAGITGLGARSGATAPAAENWRADQPTWPPVSLRCVADDGV